VFAIIKIFVPKGKEKDKTLFFRCHIHSFSMLFAKKSVQKKI